MNTYLRYIKLAAAYCFAGMLAPASAQVIEADTALVQVAFGEQQKQDILGGVSVVNISELIKKDYQNGPLDYMQSLVSGYNGNLWGQAPLVLVDGSPRDASYVDASMVESVTFLKSASALALYGSRGAKGTILITTKRGKEQPLQIDVRANTGFYFAKRYPKYLGAAEYMTLYNEACLNDGRTALYDEATIYQTAAGQLPTRYPDMDFYTGDYLRKAYNRTNVTGEVTGGNDRAHYYVNLGAQYNNSFVKYGEKKNDDDLLVNVRANVDMNITDWLTGQVNAAVNYEDSYAGRGDFWSAAATLRPNWYVPFVPIDRLDPNNETLRNIVNDSNNLIDGKYLLGGNNANQTTVFGDMLAAGYVKDKHRTFLFDVALKADLSTLLKGLSFQTAYSIDYWNYYSEGFRENYAVYEPQWANTNGQDMIIGLKKYGEDTNSTNEFVGSSYDTQTQTFRAQFDYQNTFAGSHNLSATLMGWGFQQHVAQDADHNGGQYHNTSNLNLGLRMNYNFNRRYYAEAAAALVHSAKLAEGHRDALSPSLTLGWRLSQEQFMKNVGWVDNLKLSAAYSNLKQDLDIADFYMYLGSYSRTAWYQWQDATQGGFVSISNRGSNEDLTFIQRKEWRVSLEGQLFNRLLTFDLNYFHQTTDGLLANGNTIYPSYFGGNGSFLPNLNYGQDERSGIDFSLQAQKRMGEFDLGIGLNGMYLSQKAKTRDELYADKYQNRAGKALNSAWGYECDGFFADEADIASHAQQTFGEVKPGNLKYRDQNGDNIIDSKDQIALGKYAAPFFYGVNLTLKWRNFTLFAQGTGQMGGTGFKNNSYYWIRGGSKYSEMVRGRWTEATAASATFPRLTTTDNSNDFQNSTFWKYSTSRFDLNRVQITYDLPSQLFDRKIVRALSVYVAGESLLTFSGEREYMETTIGGAPQSRFYQVGAKVSF